MEEKSKVTITREKLEEIAKIVFEERSSNPNVRTFKGRRGCITYGSVSFDSNSPFIEMCSDPKCSGCQMFQKAVKEAVKNWTDKNGTEKEDLQRVQHPSIHILKGQMQDVFPTYSKTTGEATYKTETLSNTKTDPEK